MPPPTNLKQVRELHRLKEIPDKSTANQTIEVANFCDDLRADDASLPLPTTIRQVKEQVSSVIGSLLWY